MILAALSEEPDSDDCEYYRLTKTQTDRFTEPNPSTALRTKNIQNSIFDLYVLFVAANCT